MELVYAISPLSGAVIGCFTNWVAIKMLFRPYEEKRIGRFKIPFTPGVMPKERYRLSKAVGDTINTHLLTEDVIIKAITTEAVNDNISAMVEALYNAAASCDKTVEAFIPIPPTVKPFITKKAKAALEEANAQQLVVSLLTDTALKILQINITDIGVHILSNKMYAYITGEDFTRSVSRLANDLVQNAKESDKLLCTFLPPDIWDRAADFAKANFSACVPVIEKFLADEKVDGLFRSLVADMIDQHINKLVSIFLNADKIYDSIKEGLLAYLQTEEAAEDISAKIRALPEKLSDLTLRHIIEKIPDSTLQGGIDKISTLMPSLLSEEIVRGFFDKDGSLYDVIVKIVPQTDRILADFIRTHVNGMFEKYLETYLDLAVQKGIHILSTQRISNLFAMLPANTLPHIKAYASARYPDLIASLVPRFMKSVDMAKIIEEHINEFDLRTAEHIVVSVIDKELKAITYFGGVLGFIIGLLPLLFHFIGI